MAERTVETANRPVNLPRVAITYCTQCRWMLRAAYFGQELLSTFGTSIGEIALIPATGGLFQVHLTYKPVTESGDADVKETLLWDRKSEGGFPETKVLKQRVRDCIEPSKGLGHSDVGGKKGNAAVAKEGETASTEATQNESADNSDEVKTKTGQNCEDCK
ncbi:hypothetical protein MBLNU230_g2658t1 [Neophaeotheca triangularis]